MLPKPIVRCLIARIGVNGLPLDIELVTLDTAAERKGEGWCVVGPDPDDLDALFAWYRDPAPSPPEDT
jgi:hypothetical protein